jgi:hypothetical protein
LGIYLVINFIGDKMDTTKWRTVAIRIDSYKLLKGMCEKTNRNPSNMINELLDLSLTQMSKKEQRKKQDIIKDLLKSQN